MSLCCPARPPAQRDGPVSESSSYHLTKILVTIGPASSSVDKIQALIDAGANCFRLNFSHGSQEEHKRVYENIRLCEEKSNYPVGVIADLQGPKLRIAGMPEGGAKVAAGDTLTLKLGDGDGDGQTCFLPHPEIFAAVRPESMLLVDDGRIRLQVIECGKEQLRAKVTVGGLLKSNKGVNLPGVMLPLSALTARDEANLEFALGLGADWIALSFVQSPEDLEKARRIIDGRARLIAKIEKPLAVEKIEEIVDAADGIMIARGDLGVEVDAAEVPALQKRLIRLCRIKSRPVIVATQMLESMTASPTPTRAEASDVATAVYEGADAVMLSAETASGSYPVEAVDIMRRIIISTEAADDYRKDLMRDHDQIRHEVSDAIVNAAIETAGIVKAKCIASFSQTGNTTMRASRLRPSCPLLGLTPRIGTARMASLFWGVRSIKAPDLDNPDDMARIVTEIAKKHGFAEDGDFVIATAGIPLGKPGRTNVMRIAVVGED